MERLHGRASDKTAVPQGRVWVPPYRFKGYALCHMGKQQSTVCAQSQAVSDSCVAGGEEESCVTFKDRGKQGGVAPREQPSGPAPD